MFEDVQRFRLAEWLYDSKFGLVTACDLPVPSGLRYDDWPNHNVISIHSGGSVYFIVAKCARFYAISYDQWIDS